MSRGRAAMAVACLWLSLGFLVLHRGVDPLFWLVALPATLLVSIGVWTRGSGRS